MNRTAAILLLLLVAALASPAAAAEPTAPPPNVVAGDDGDLVVHPVEHASLVLTAGGHRVAVDPTGGADGSPAYEGATLVLITDIHGDHFHPETAGALAAAGAAVVAPAAVAEKMEPALREQTTVLANGERATVAGVALEAIPMYNLTEGRLERHPKGRGNGYLLELAGQRVYVSGDTEDVPEMRALEDVDVAFVCMNLPYTMSVDQAASAVAEMKPGIVFPYHYRGQDGLADVGRFAELVSAAAPAVEVRQLDWYPEE